MEQRREHCTTEGWSANVKATFQNVFEAKLLVRTCVMLMELTHWFSEMVDKGDRNNCEDCPLLDGTDVQVDSKEDLDMTDLCPDSCEAVESVDHKPYGKSRNIEMSVDITDNESPLVHDDINPSCNVSCNLVDELDFGQLGVLFYHATSSLETISQMFIENDDTSDHTRNHTKQKPHTQKAKPSNINLKVRSSGRVIENILRKLRLMVKQCESWLSSEENKTKFFEANSDLLVQDVPTESSNVNVHASACQTTSPVCFEQSSQTINECHMVNKGTEKYDEEAQFEREKLEQELAQSRETWKREENHFKKQLLDISQRNVELAKTLTSAQDELRETLLELGRLSVENTKMIRENQTKFKLLDELQSKQSSTATPQPLSLQTSQSEPTLGAEALSKPDDQHQLHDNAVKNSPNEIEGTAEHPPDHTTESAQLHGEESNVREVISLSNVPTTAVERSMYNNYKLLLFTMPPRFLFSDVEKLKEFASRNYSIDVSQSVLGIFLELDRKGIISASNLTPLREFFEGALRFDLIHLIDCFLLGDYAVLRNTNSTRFPKNNSGITNTRTRSLPSSQGTTIPPSQLVMSSASGGSNPGYPTYQPGLKGGRKEAEGSMRPTNRTNQTFPVRADSNHVRKSPVDMGSNGNKLSKFERSDSPRNQNSNRQAPDDDSDDDDGSQWLCSHYKRRCHVKFDCCDKYWPCHRCHNNESNCGQKKLKSRDTKFIKCVNCKTEQEFGEGSQFCVNCKAKLAKYFCSSCKHLTGTDDHPYHCEKCGICRIHQNRSFHCDVCGVCLDVQLRGNHKCRAGSAHDECCICLEDAFTGCQILPCSHKVHKECATQMIRSGITRCPICRESFAHKLERRTLPPPKKHNGKK